MPTFRTLQDSLPVALKKSRSHYQNNPGSIGYRILNGHLDACVALKLPPEGWELYEFFRVYRLPQTVFFNEHREEIISEVSKIIPAKMLFAQFEHSKEFIYSLSDEPPEAKQYTFDTALALYSPDTEESWIWFKTECAIWIDPRDRFRSIFEKGAKEHLNDIEKKLLRVKEKLEKKRSKRTRLLLQRQQHSLEQLQNNVMQAVEETDRHGELIYKFEQIKTFPKQVFEILRKAENVIRARKSQPLVGENWTTQTELYFRIKRLLPSDIVEYNGQPDWLGSRQTLDILLPERRLAIAYLGIDHFDNSNEDFETPSPNEKTKKASLIRSQCERNGVISIVLKYDLSLNDEQLLNLLYKRMQ